jgi:hypothetical protein
MAVTGIGSVVRGVFDAVLRPHRFVEFQTSSYASTRRETVRQLGSLVVVYAVNLATYATPLTLAGIGVQQGGQPPAAYAGTVGSYGLDPTASWQLLSAFVQNSLFITAATVLTLLSLHVGVLIVRESRGVVQSTHTVVYTTSAYLAAVFSGVWYLTSQPGVSGAREFVVNLQAAFVYVVIDLLGADLALPGGRPGEVAVASITTEGQWVLALLAVGIGYYLFSLYLGARINHQASRSGAFVAVTSVALSPVAYVVGSVAATLIT